MITSPYSFVASANCAIYEGATPVFADIDPQTFNLDPAAVEAAITPRTKAVVAVDIFGYPVRARRAARDLRPARARARRGRVRGARRALQGPAARLARPPGRLRLLPEQADHDRRGRRGHDRLGRGARAARLAPQPGPARDVELARSTAGSASTTGSTTSRPRSGSGSSRSSTGSSAARREVAARYAELLAGVDVELPLADDADHERSWFVYVVKLPRGVDRDARDRRASAPRGSRARRTCRRSTCSRTCASATASPRALCPVSEDASARTMAIPFHARLAREDQERVVDALARSPLAAGLRRSGIIAAWPTAPQRMIFLGFGKYVRADKIYALEPLARRAARPRRAHARLGRGDRRADRRVAHRARDRRRDGRQPGGRERPDRRRGARSRPAGGRRGRAGPVRRRRPRPPRAAAARVDGAAEPESLF